MQVPPGMQLVPIGGGAPQGSGQPGALQGSWGAQRAGAAAAAAAGAAAAAARQLPAGAASQRPACNGAPPLIRVLSQTWGYQALALRIILVLDPCLRVQLVCSCVQRQRG